MPLPVYKLNAAYKVASSGCAGLHALRFTSSLPWRSACSTEYLLHTVFGHAAGSEGGRACAATPQIGPSPALADRSSQPMRSRNLRYSSLAATASAVFSGGGFAKPVDVGIKL